MKKLKTILQCNIVIVALLFFTFIYVFYKLNHLENGVYDSNITSIVGIINKISIQNDKVILEVLAQEKILVTYYLSDGAEFGYQLGDKIYINGTIDIPSKNTSFNLFNYRKYLLSKRIYHIFKADHISLISPTNHIFYKIKNNLIKRINCISKSKNYLYAFILGDNHYISEDVKASYQINGISHLFAVSGMHVSLLSTIILKILHKIKKKREKNYLVVFLFMFFYAFLTNFQPSIIRAIFLFLLLNINRDFRLNLKTIQIYLYLVCVVLIINPYLIYNNGFLFSYIVTFFLVLFGSISSQFSNYFLKILVISFISFLAGLPIVINSYFSVNVISFILNIIFVPFVSFFLFPLSLLTLFISPLDFLLHFGFQILEVLSLFFSKFSIFTLSMHYLNMIGILGYYFIILIILTYIKKGKYTLIPFLYIVLIIHHNILLFNPNAYFIMLDVGQGDSILIILPFNKGNILVDTGGIVCYGYHSSYSIVDKITIPYLKSIGVNKLHYLILSHADYDHMGEAINLVENFKVDKLIFNCGEFNDLEKKLTKVLDKKSIEYYSCVKELKIDKYKLQFLNTREYDNENDNSSVIYTEINGYKFLFMGDASILTEKEILNKYNIPNVDVFKVGHHGSNTSSSEEFINVINPKYALISVGKNNRYGHPKKSVLENLENSKIYRTDLDGSVMFKIKKNKLKIETCAP